MSIPRSASDSALISLAVSSRAGKVMKPLAATSVARKVKTSPSSGGTNPSSGGSSQSLVVTKVVPPIMGGVIVEGGKYPVETAFTGGKPNPAWTKLVNPTAVNVSPNQLRSVGSKSTTAYNLRRAGLPDKFKKGDGIMFFARWLNEFAIDAGMDTITYRLDPTNPADMISALTEWPRFNIAVVRKSSAAVYSSWDQYDKSNDECLRTFILESLVGDLKEKFSMKLKSADTAMDLFFLLVNEIQPHSAKMVDNKNELIKSIVPQKYPGQNITLFCDAVRKPVQELTKANAYDSQLNLNIAENLLKANADYKFQDPIKIIQFALEEELPKLTHLNNASKAKHLEAIDLGSEHLLTVAEDRYKLQMLEGNVEWPPACHAKDSKAAPTNFGSANLTQVHGSSQTKGVCHECGKPGHYRRNCPTTNTNKITPPPATETPIRHVNGEPEFEKTIQNRKMFWCKHFNRWSTTVLTAPDPIRESSLDLQPRRTSLLFLILLFGFVTLR